MIMTVRGELELQGERSALDALGVFERALQSRFDLVSGNASGIVARASWRAFFGSAHPWPKPTHPLIAFRAATFVRFEREGAQEIAYLFESTTPWWMLPVALGWAGLFHLGGIGVLSSVMLAFGMACAVTIVGSVSAKVKAKKWILAHCAQVTEMSATGGKRTLATRP